MNAQASRAQRLRLLHDRPGLFGRNALEAGLDLGEGGGVEVAPVGLGRLAPELVAPEGPLEAGVPGRPRNSVISAKRARGSRSTSS
jgi:hypothetical protein